MPPRPPAGRGHAGRGHAPPARGALGATIDATAAGMGSGRGRGQDGPGPIVNGSSDGEAPAAASQAYVDRVPYGFWPQLPWPSEDDIGPTPDPTTHAAAWMATKPYRKDKDERHWHGVRFLGRGGYGCAGLWCEEDKDGNVSRRMVVKETTISNASWRDPQNWRNRLPREIAIHRRVGSSQRRNDRDAGSRSLIRHYGYRLMMRKRRYRLYLEYCESMDLHYALTTQNRLWSTQNIKHRLPRNAHSYIPEHFIWHVFRDLVNACLVLQDGQVDGGRMKGWRSITHRDINPTNIFLAEKDKHGVSQV